MNAITKRGIHLKTNLHIAIDGPAGSGKSTVAKRLAGMLNIKYVDTGAMYRAVTYSAIKNGISKGNTTDIVRLAKTSQIELKNGITLLDGEDISAGIREPAVDGRVSEVASIPEVRDHLVALQRQMAQNNSVVMDGRDIGTTVLPRARWKFFLTATLEERTKRRYGDLTKISPGIRFEQVMKKLRKRDYIDSTRGYSPLKAADDAIIFDTTGKNVDMVLSELMDIIGGKERCFTR